MAHIRNLISITLVLSGLGFGVFWGLPLAATVHWESVPLRTQRQKSAGLLGGEGGQYVHAIKYAPSNPKIAYFSTDTSGVWRSNDGGYSWVSKKRGFVAHGARSLVVDPVNENIVFAAGFLGKNEAEAVKYPQRVQGIFKTADGGENWDLVYRTDFYKQESKGDLFAFDSRSIQDTYTSSLYCASYSEGLLRSSDGGKTWNHVGFDGHQIISMEEDPEKHGQLLVASNRGFFRFAEGNTLKIGKGLEYAPLCIAISTTNSEVVYATTGRGGVYKSSDGGSVFVRMSNGLPLRSFTDIAVSSVNAEIVYVRAHKTGLEPFYSHDGGRSWRNPETTDWGDLLDDEQFFFSSLFAPHPTQERSALHVSNGRARILKTEDGGVRWMYSSSGFTGGRMRNIAFPKPDQMLFCLTDHGLWLTENGGDTFREFKVERILGGTSSQSAAICGQTIVASVGSWYNKGLAISQDLGKSWKYFGEMVDPFHCISFHPSDRDVIYAGPYISSNRGRTWTKLSHCVRAVYPKDGDILYALSSIKEGKCKVVQSQDQGKTWGREYPVLPFSGEAIQDIAIAPDNHNRIYLATSSGVWIYDGKNWIQKASGDGIEKDAFGLCYVSCIAVDSRKPNSVYVGRRSPGYGRSNGVFRSTDYGLTWSDVNGNLGSGLTVWAIEISPINGDVYIGTSLGTFRLGSDLKDSDGPQASAE